MISSIEIADIASFKGKPEQLENLTKLNFIFGSNGTGKTTISRVIADSESKESCSVQWKGTHDLECFVYNKDFKEKNFEQESTLKGIFTLGEEEIDTQSKIEATKSEVEKLDSKIRRLTSTLEGPDGSGGKRKELQELKTRFEERCWQQKREYDDEFAEAFSGYRNSRSKFAEKVLDEDSNNEAELSPLENLKEKANTVFSSDLSIKSNIPVPDCEALISHESNPILSKAVVGSSDVDIADMIDTLGNSDWVSRGREYFEVNDGSCPFCQQTAPAGFADELQRYFDKMFEQDRKEIENLEDGYLRDSESIITEVAQLVDESSDFLDSERLSSLLDVLKSKVEANISKIEVKKKEPSRKVNLDTVETVTNKIILLIKNTNKKIDKHNETVRNSKEEKERLTAEVWRFVLDKLSTDLKRYHEKRNDLRKGIIGLEKGIENAEEKINDKQKKIQQLERNVTSVKPTADAINQILKSFGFQNFKLEKAGDRPAYKLVRPDGSDAKKTLSEGEKTFVTFLYFYHLLQGSDSKSGAMKDRVVVFDDPVSSLDSDVLFVVSSLIRNLCSKVGKDNSHVKQVFVMTHNVYFHRQVTYNYGERPGVYAFWLVRKNADGSYLTECESNPVRSSYELLWAEICDQENRSNFAVQNAMRRILEHYFKILGGRNFESILQEFEGNEKRICTSLISWMHAGSHHANEDLYVSVEDATVDAYLKVFKEIFEKCDQTRHYEMMMEKVSQ